MKEKHKNSIAKLSKKAENQMKLHFTQGSDENLSLIFLEKVKETKEQNRFTAEKNHETKPFKWDFQ